MKERLADLIVSPCCHSELELRVFLTETVSGRGKSWKEIREGVLNCKCGEWYPIIEHVPRLVKGSLRDSYEKFASSHDLKLPDSALTRQDTMRRTQKDFSDKWWINPRWGFRSPKMKKFYDDWFRRKVGIETDDAFDEFLKSKKMMLDAGTGLGAKVESMCLRSRGEVIGVDVASSVVNAYRNTKKFWNAHIVQADILALPFKPGLFDFIISDGVLHHTPNPEKSFLRLASHLSPKGIIAIHIYKKMGPIKEFCDDLLRAATTKMSPEECWEACRAFTKLGKSLTDKHVEIEIPEDIPILQIKAGRYDLQRFIYYSIFKCFWNEEFTFDENNMVNFDWYYSQHAFRLTKEEVEGWFGEAGLENLRFHEASINGISATGAKPG